MTNLQQMHDSCKSCCAYMQLRPSVPEHLHSWTLVCNGAELICITKALIYICYIQSQSSPKTDGRYMLAFPFMEQTKKINTSVMIKCSKSGFFSLLLIRANQGFLLLALGRFLFRFLFYLQFGSFFFTCICPVYFCSPC